MMETRLIDILPEVQKIVGNSNESFLLRRVTDVVELLANKGDFDALLGTLDICVSSRIVTLPPEVEVILGCNMVGTPAMARDNLFEFHLNGPGSCGAAIRYEWMDMGDTCTYRELACPGRLYGYCYETADEQCEMWAEGLDTNGNTIRTEVSEGNWRDGYKIPVFKTYHAADADAPIFARITRIRKPLTAGPLRVTTIAGEGTDEILLGVYQSYETLPKYRRIKLSTEVDWVRIYYRKRNLEVRSRYDILPLAPAQAIIMGLRALKAYDSPGGFAEGEAFEATAVRWITEDQMTRRPNAVHPVQVSDASPLLDSFDSMD
jgi:hypothetical protein